MTLTPGPPLAGKCAVVTGGSRGIGRAIVERLARDGAAVLFSFHSNRDAADSVVDRLRREGLDASALPLDLEAISGLREFFDQAERMLGALDIVVNNAGIATTSSVAETSEADYERVMAVNARAVFFCIQEAARRLRSGGRIVSLSSINTGFASPTTAVYSASKAAVEQFTAIAARELGERAITVNAVSPGMTDTDMLRASNAPEALDEVAGMTPLGRLGDPHDIASVVSFLVGDDGRWVTGQTLVASGGLQ